MFNEVQKLFSEQHNRPMSTALVGEETGIKDVKTSNSLGRIHVDAYHVKYKCSEDGGTDEFNAFLQECVGYYYYVAGKNAQMRAKKKKNTA